MVMATVGMRYTVAVAEIDPFPALAALMTIVSIWKIDAGAAYRPVLDIVPIVFVPPLPNDHVTLGSKGAVPV